MRRRVLAVALSLSVAWVIGCSSSDLCSRAQSESTSLAQKAAPCSDGGLTVVSKPFNMATCQTAEKQCTSADITTIDNIYTCLDSVGVCTPSTALPWAFSLVACMPADAGISTACTAALQTL
jgi:hypothetical protein